MLAAKKRTFISAVLILSLMFSLFSALQTKTYASNGPSVAERIEALENALGVSSGSSTLIDRVAYLEEQCFGETKTGTLESRIEALENELLGGTSGSGNQPPKDRTDEGEKLTEKDYFSRDYWVDAGKNDDSFGNHYESTIYASKGSMDSSVKNLKYYLGEEYTELTATLFIPDDVNSSSGNYSFMWADAVFKIYLTDIDGNETLAYKKNDFTAEMKPLDISIDLTGADFLRFEWENTFYYNTGAACPLFEIGNPMIYK